MEKKISDMMDYIQDDSVNMQIKDIASIDKIKEATMNKLHQNANKHKWTRKVSTIVIAATLATILLAGTAFAIYYISLKDLILPEAGTVTPVQDTDSQYYENQRISLQGYSDSDESKAVAEWIDFYNNYDKDGTILRKIGNSDTGLDITYKLYGAYTQEMADKLDEIAAKYGLRLHADRAAYDADKLMDTVAGKSFIGEGITPTSGYIYEDGTFLLDGILSHEDDIAMDFRETLSDDTVMVIYNEDTDGYTVLYVNEPPDNLNDIIPPKHNGPVIVMTFDEYGEDINMRKTDLPLFQLVYCKNGTITDVSLHVGNIDDYTQWQYQTACGVTVSLAQSAYQSLIIVQYEDAFVTVSTEGSTALSHDRLEAVADAIDFSILK